MSKFEVCISPPQNRKKCSNESREPTILEFGPFTKKAVISFLDVPVGKIARRILTIMPRNVAETMISVSERPDPSSNLSIEWEIKEMKTEAQNLEIVWTPTKAGIYNEVIVLSSDNGLQKDVKLVMKSIEAKKLKVTVTQKIRPQLSKRLKPSPKKISVNRIALQQSANAEKTFKLATSTPAITKVPLKENNHNIEKTFQTISTDEYFKQIDKENKNPVASNNLFENLNFTPLKNMATIHENSLDNLAALPTPLRDYKMQECNIRLEDSNVSILANMETPKITRKTVTIVDTNTYNQNENNVTVMVENSSSNVIENMIGKTFVKANLFENFDELSMIDKTRNITPPPVLSVIEEENEIGFQSKTFNIEEKKKIEGNFLTPISRKRISLSTKELHRPSPSYAWQGSMPNLLDAKENIDIKNIENNRYFFQCNKQEDANESVISICNGMDPLFRETEIKAQSSQFNLNEVGLKPTNSCLNITQKFSESSLNYSSKSHKSSPHLSAKEFHNVDRFLTPSVPVSVQQHGIRSKTWGSIKPKKQYSFPTKLTLKPSTQPKIEKNFLYNPDLHLNININPDPFSATMTIDPFLAATMYLDEETIFKHELKLKNWLNALVKIPDDLDSNKTKVDVGKLFTEVQNKKQITETKEKVVTKFYKNRFDHLRTVAIKLYQSTEVVKVLSSIQPQIEGGFIQIKDDCDLQLQCGLQQQVLDLLFCFNTLWLRLGLEVVTGEIIPTNSNSDLHALTRFIIEKIFKNEFLEQKYKKRQIDTVNYKAKLKKHNLNRILCLLYFLDVAKNSKIIKQNPCLFTKNSIHKETREILIRFASLMLSKMGDITRHMKRFNYVLTHKQSYLDEFDYAFDNLAIDLRDGVRLTKVMEIILLREDLSSQLRVPAISRTQKIHNVDIALKALINAEFLINGNISAKDIADGHREKTLSLLWQIIYKFRSPKFNQAAHTIQKCWRKYNFRLTITRRIAEKQMAKLNFSATLIQKTYKGFIARRWFQKYRKEKISACIIIQSHVKKYLAMKNYKSMCRKKNESYCATKIQSCLKMIIVRKQFVKIRVSTIKIQRIFRSYLLMKKEHTYYEKLRKTVLLLQRRLRANNLMKSQRTQYLRKLSLIIKIQQKFRALRAMKVQRKLYLDLKSSVAVVENHYIANVLMKNQRNQFLRLKAAVICVEEHYKASILMRKQNNKYLQIRNAVVLIQKSFRGYLQMKEARTNFILFKLAALALQVRYRSIVLMRKERKKFLDLKCATIKIQRLFRVKRIRSAVLVIQRKFRAIMLAKKVQANFENLKWATITIQRQYRAQVQMKKAKSTYVRMKAAAIKIQNFYRGFKQSQKYRSSFLVKRKACVKIQQYFRCYIRTKEQRIYFLKVRNSVIIIQQKFRAMLIMRSERSNYLEKIEMITRLQLWFRSTNSMRKQRDYYLKLCKVTVMLQRKIRTKQLMLKEKSNFARIKNATILIQRRFRDKLKMRKDRKNFLMLKCATVKIQIWWKARKSFITLSKHVQIVQRLWRRKLQARQYHHEYLCYRQAVIKVQQRYKAKLKMKYQKNEYLTLKRTALLLQNMYRKKMIMIQAKNHFNSLKQSTITLQRYFRAYLEMKHASLNYKRTREAVTFIQQKYRAHLMMKKDRKEFLRYRHAAIVVQKYWRSKLLCVKERSNYVQLKKVTLSFQARCRGFLTRKKFRESLSPEMIEYRKKNKIVKIIQAAWRGYSTRKRFQTKHFQQIRARLENAKEKKTSNSSVRSQLIFVVNALKGSYKLEQAIGLLRRLERLSRIAPYTLEPHAHFISSFCYGLMAQAIRSEPDKILIELCACVVLNMARYPPTADVAFSESGLTTIAQMLLRWCDKECGIFITLCTLIWLFGQCPRKNEKIRKFMVTSDAIFMLKETQKLTIRKGKMRKSIKKPFGCHLTQLPNHIDPMQLPSLSPDYGLIRGRPYVFYSPSFALETVLSTFSVNL